MFKKNWIFIMLFALILGICFMDMMDPDAGWARKVTYYLSQWSSTTTKTFYLSGKADAPGTSDTTTVFVPREYMTFWVEIAQDGDSVGVSFVYYGSTRIYSDLISDAVTNAFVPYDSAIVYNQGATMLNWSHFKTGSDSTLLISPVVDYAYILMTANSNSGDSTAVKIRYMGAAGKDW